MKLYTTFAASLQTALFATTMAQATTPLRIMTWNLRFDSMPNNITVQEVRESRLSQSSVEVHIDFNLDHR